MFYFHADMIVRLLPCVLLARLGSGDNPLSGDIQVVLGVFLVFCWLWTWDIVVTGALVVCYWKKIDRDCEEKQVVNTIFKVNL